MINILLKQTVGGNMVLVEVNGEEVGVIEVTDGHWDYTDYNNPTQAVEINHISELFEMFE